MILGLTLYLASRFEVPVKHSLSMDFKDAAFRKASANGCTHGCRIGTSCLSQQHGFSNDCHRPPNDQLVTQFGDLPRSIRADKCRTAHNIEYRFSTPEIVIGSTHHNSQSARFGTNYAA